MGSDSHKEGTKRKKAKLLGSSSEVRSKRKKIDATMIKERKHSMAEKKDEAEEEEERSLDSFRSIYDYLENTQSKHLFADFAALKELYIPLLVRDGDEYTTQEAPPDVDAY
ncbi:hypothetical protein AAVH_08132 [Aphelenchoides avenae]|nr:hypothetical protein AAVH_08132 [Aphelenchus avenae]